MFYFFKRLLNGHIFDRCTKQLTKLDRYIGTADNQRVKGVFLWKCEYGKGKGTHKNGFHVSSGRFHTPYSMPRGRLRTKANRKFNGYINGTFSGPIAEASAEQSAHWHCQRNCQWNNGRKCLPNRTVYGIVSGRINRTVTGTVREAALLRPLTASGRFNGTICGTVRGS